MDNDNICGAKTKSNGTPCQRKPAKGSNRCKLHGGATPRGHNSPHWQHGMYSKYAGESLKDVLEDLDGISSDELINADNELKLLQALIMKSKAIEDGTGDLKDLDVISKVIERLVKAKQRAVALKIEEERLIPVEDVRYFLSWMEDLLLKKMEETKAYEILDELENFKISDNHAH